MPPDPPSKRRLLRLRQYLSANFIPIYSPLDTGLCNMELPLVLGGFLYEFENRLVTSVRFSGFQVTACIQKSLQMHGRFEIYIEHICKRQCRSQWLTCLPSVVTGTIRTQM